MAPYDEGAIGPAGVVVVVANGFDLNIFEMLDTAPHCFETASRVSARLHFHSLK